MQEPKTDIEKLSKLDELMKELNIAMLTTLDADGNLHSRPMGYQHPKEGFEGTLYFFTRGSSPKISEVEDQDKVNVSFSNPKSQDYVSLSGSAYLSRDHTKMAELWSPILKAWFPDELADPDIALIVINVDTAEYWDAPNGAAVQLLGYLKSAVTGTTIKAGENEKIDMSHVAVSSGVGTR